MMKYLLVLLLLIAPAFAKTTISGKVVAVVDGDTLDIVDAGKRQYRIRLAQIDCPETSHGSKPGQPWGKKAKQALAGLVFGKQVVVRVIDKEKTTNRKPRLIGEVFLGRLNINQAMVVTGNCWAYRKYVRDPVYLRLEQYAKSKKRGLWSLQADQRIPPWEWRHQGPGGDDWKDKAAGAALKLLRKTY